MFISSEQLHNEISSKEDIVVIEAACLTYSGALDVLDDFSLRRIPGAVLLDLAFVADFASEKGKVCNVLLPETRKWSIIMGRKFGMRRDTSIVVYDRQEAPSCLAIRLWWTCQVFGHQGNVRILDGGFAKWIEGQFPVESGEPRVPVPVPYIIPDDCRVPIEDHVATTKDIKEFLNGANIQVVDLRTSAAYTGATPKILDEPCGHIPGSINISAGSFWRDDRTLLAVDELQEHLKEHGVDLRLPTIVLSHDGVDATVLPLVSFQLGSALGIDFPPVRVFDGSWQLYVHEGIGPINRMSKRPSLTKEELGLALNESVNVPSPRPVPVRGQSGDITSEEAAQIIQAQEDKKGAFESSSGSSPAGEGLRGVTTVVEELGGVESTE